MVLLLLYNNLMIHIIRFYCISIFITSMQRLRNMRWEKGRETERKCANRFLLGCDYLALDKAEKRGIIIILTISIYPNAQYMQKGTVDEKNYTNTMERLSCFSHHSPTFTFSLLFFFSFFGGHTKIPLLRSFS